MPETEPQVATPADAPAPPPTTADLLKKKLDAQAFEYGKLDGITAAAFNIQHARKLLTENAGFDVEHTDVVALDAVLADLGKYA